MTTPRPPRAQRTNRKDLLGIPRSVPGSLRRAAMERSRRAAPEPPGGHKFHTRAMLLVRAQLTWLWEWLRNLLKPTRPLPPLPAGSSGIYALPDGPCTVGLAGDWGSGTADAYAVGDALGRLQPDVTIHLGDVYYAGRSDEFADFFLPKNCWPRGSRGTYVLNGNHEMYSGGEGYFDRALEEYGQPTSYFCLQNNWWRIVALDTGYHCSKDGDLLLIALGLKRDSTRLPDPCITWLTETVFADPDDRRPVILLTHHQPFSAFKKENVYPQVVAPLTPFLHRVALWFWGHEHRLALYARYQNIRGRCIGHGGIPIELPFPDVDPAVPLVLHDARPGEPIDGEQIGLNGFVTLGFEATGGLRIRYYDQRSRDAEDFLLEEHWVQQNVGAVGTGVRLGPRGGAMTASRALPELIR